MKNTNTNKIEGGKNMAFDAKAYNNEYKRTHNDRLAIRVPKGAVEQLHKMAKNQGKTYTGFIRDALYHYMDDLGIDRINLG